LRLERFSGDLPATAAQRRNIQTTFLRARWRLACTYHRWLHGGGYALPSPDASPSFLSLSLFLYPPFPTLLRFLSCSTFTGNTHGIKPRMPSLSLHHAFALLFFLPSFLPSLMPLYPSLSFLRLPPPSYLKSNAIHRRQARRARLPFSPRFPLG